MILRGQGQCLLADAVTEVGPHDLVTIPSWTWHQFHASRGEPLGFLCMVNRERDKPQLPNDEERGDLEKVLRSADNQKEDRE